MQACKILLFLTAISLAQASLSAEFPYSSKTIKAALEKEIGKETLEEFLTYENAHIEQLASKAGFLGLTVSGGFSQEDLVKFMEANSPEGKDVTQLEVFKSPKYSDWKARAKEHFGLSDDDATDDLLAPLFKDIIIKVKALNGLYTGYIFARLVPREVDPQESHMNISGAMISRMLGAALDEGSPAAIIGKIDDLLASTERELKKALGVWQEDEKMPKNPTMPGDRIFQENECSLM
jgi:hypothetical protein